MAEDRRSFRRRFRACDRRAQVEAGRLLFARECRFVAGAADAAALPPESLPEIAFVGRSNVGKSSLVNALTGRRMLARTSNTPGRTRQINFFELDGRLMLVDLPGYGYAEASKSRDQGAGPAWCSIICGNAGSLRRVCLLIDSRHGIKEAGPPVDGACSTPPGFPIQVVLTKIDKLGPAARAAVAEQVAAELARHMRRASRDPPDQRRQAPAASLNCATLSPVLPTIGSA